jgi:hypothetical protein
MFLNYFEILILKIIFLKKYYFNTFQSEKHFKKQSNHTYDIYTLIYIYIYI